MPSPTDVLLRTHGSPVPTHTVFGSVGSMRTSPMHWVYLSNTGLNVIAPSIDFHKPPPAAPTYTVVRSPTCTPSIAAMRPDITAGPIARGSRPANVSLSTLTWAAASGGSTESAA